MRVERKGKESHGYERKARSQKLTCVTNEDSATTEAPLETESKCDRCSPMCATSFNSWLTFLNPCTSYTRTTVDTTRRISHQYTGKNESKKMVNRHIETTPLITGGYCPRILVNLFGHSNVYAMNIHRMKSSPYFESCVYSWWSCFKVVPIVLYLPVCVRRRNQQQQRRRRRRRR